MTHDDPARENPAARGASTLIDVLAAARGAGYTADSRVLEHLDL